MRIQLHPHQPTVLLAGGVDGLVVARRSRLRDRLVARMRRRRLDRALAEGTPPEASAALALRAQRLTEPDQRSSMAGALRRILREAQEGQRPTLGRIMPSRARIKSAREELTQLADTLEDPGPVAAGGAAQAWILLTDGTGPLYNPASRTTLRAGAARAVRELRPWPA
ncbi:MAG: hypothetical protein JOY56_15325 [Solirubrobacterales bacterium]|nr:hypothetical protein [Solirubrobacterales bacterium]MBV8944267.1 hypothetical protein [Solirubrobacterales bacterium]MBV9363458.1 hypothetical protein [Solirubrobacterales bacterium]MBV9682349.1 hypothetical protein [Solirubrobacterales bacterium]